MAITVVIADDHEIVREGLRSLIASEPDIHIIGEAEDGKAGVRMVEDLQPDIVIMDVTMPNMGGIEATGLIKQKCPRTKVVALSAYDKREFVLDMLSAGASAYLLKDNAFAELVKALRAVSGGECYLCPKIATVVLNSRTDQSRHVTLVDPRDLELIRLLAKGLHQRQIAQDWGVSVKTVEARRRRVISKLGVDSFAGLVRYAVERGLVDESPHMGQ